MRLAIAVSLVMHALLALALLVQVSAPAPAVKPRPAAIEIEIAHARVPAAEPAGPAQPPVRTSAAEEAALLPGATGPERSPEPGATAPPRAHAAPATARHGPSRARASRASPPAGASRAAEPASPPAAASRLSMRGTEARAPGEPATSRETLRPAQPGAPGAVDLSPAHAARLVRPEALAPVPSPLELPGPPPADVDVRDDWSPAGGGTYRADTTVFTATIDRDGRVTIEDKPSFQWKLGRPRGEREEGGPGQAATAQDAPIAWMKMELATFDLTDWVMRMGGQDPYAHRKARFLDDSRDARADMRARAQAEDLRDAVAALPGLLRRTWQDTSLSPAQRRAMLFRLWDECVEAGPADVVRRGNTARVMILAFIRRHLPAGSAHAYTGAEIEVLNAGRESEQPFAPYP